MTSNLDDIASAMVARGKGILAADESTATIKKRFDSIATGSTEDTRRNYREMLFTAEDAMRSYISGGLTLAVLVMPIVILITMEALRAVPPSIREGAYGVGATRWEVVRSHVLPNAAPGIFTGAILAMARAFGETAPLLLVGAVTGYFSSASGRTPLEVLQGPYTALPTQIFSFAKLPANEWQPNTAAAIIVLLVAILVVNFLAILLRNRYERTW